MKNKILAILIMAVFVLSIVPVGFAQMGLREKQGEMEGVCTAQYDPVCGANGRTYSNECRARAAGMEVSHRGECKNGEKRFDEAAERLQELKENSFRLRQISKNRIEDARENYLLAKNRLMQAEQNISIERLEFTKSRALLAVCEDGENATNTTACGVLRERTQLHAKNFVIKTAEKIIAILEKVKFRAQSSEDLSEEEVNATVADIDARIAALEEAIETIKTSDNKEEVLKAVKLVMDEWQNRTRPALLLHIEKLKNAKIGNIIARSENLEEKLANITSNLQEQGQNVTEINALINVFNQRIEEAKEKYEMSLGLFEQAKNATTGAAKGALVKQAQQYHKEAENALKEAHGTLKQIVRLIKAKDGGEREIEEREDKKNETEEEDEEEEEEETECTTDADCSEGKRCKNNECEEIECTTDADCSEGKRCKDNECEELEEENEGNETEND